MAGGLSVCGTARVSGFGIKVIVLLIVVRFKDLTSLMLKTGLAQSAVYLVEL